MSFKHNLAGSLGRNAAAFDDKRHEGRLGKLRRLSWWMRDCARRCPTSLELKTHSGVSAYWSVLKQLGSACVSSKDEAILMFLADRMLVFTVLLIGESYLAQPDAEP